MTEPTRTWVTIVAAAEHADVSPKTIRRRIADGSLTAYRFGPRLIRVDLNELDTVLRPMAADHGGGANPYIGVV